MTNRSCSSCGNSIRGHKQPWGKKCKATRMTSEAELSVVSSAASLVVTSAITTQAGDIVNVTVDPVAAATATTSSASTSAQLQQELAKLQVERKELEELQKQNALLKQIQQLRQENAALRTAMQVPEMTAQPVVRSVPEVAAGPISSVPTIAELRGMSALNDQVNHIIYGNSTAAAIANPVTAQENLADKVSTTTATNKGKSSKVLSPEHFAHRSGLAELSYERLSIQEFVVGSVRIILNGGVSSTEKEARLKHLLEIMILAAHYTWPAVRALYGHSRPERVGEGAS